MDNKEILARSNLAKDFLESEFWQTYLKPWIDIQERQLKDEYFSFPNLSKFHSKREDLKARVIGCTMIEKVLKTWMIDRELRERSEEMKKADKKMAGSLG